MGFGKNKNKLNQVILEKGGQPVEMSDKKRNKQNQERKEAYLEASPLSAREAYYTSIPRKTPDDYNNSENEERSRNRHLGVVDDNPLLARAIASDFLMSLQEAQDQGLNWDVDEEKFKPTYDYWVEHPYNGNYVSHDDSVKRLSDLYRDRAGIREVAGYNNYALDNALAVTEALARDAGYIPDMPSGYNWYDYGKDGYKPDPFVRNRPYSVDGDQYGDYVARKIIENPAEALKAITPAGEQVPDYRSHPRAMKKLHH